MATADRCCEGENDMENKIYILKSSVIEGLQERLSEALEALKGDESQHLAYKRVRDVQDALVSLTLEQNIKL